MVNYCLFFSGKIIMLKEGTRSLPTFSRLKFLSVFRDTGRNELRHKNQKITKEIDTRTSFSHYHIPLTNFARKNVDHLSKNTN